MTEELLDSLVVAARNELHDALDPAPPDIDRVARRARGRRRAISAAILVAVCMLSAMPLVIRDGNQPATVVAGPRADGVTLTDKAGPLQLEVVISAVEVTVGKPVSVSLTAKDERRRRILVGTVFGDGEGALPGGLFELCETKPAPAGWQPNDEVAPSQKSTTHEHVYDSPGVYVIAVGAVAAGCGEETTEVEVRRRVVVVRSAPEFQP